MNILLQTSDFTQLTNSNTGYNLANIHFLDKKTNIIMDGVFSKILFSNSYITMNGLFFDFPIKHVMTNRVYARDILQLDVINNKDILQKIIDIERQLLQYYSQYFNVHNKTIAFNLKNQINSGSIKYYKSYDYSYESKQQFYIKISGIWENSNEIGITFKIIEYQKKI
jgi:hypothetical protein